MRFALGLDVTAAPTFAAVLPLDEYARPRIVPESTVPAPTSTRIDSLIDAIGHAIEAVTEEEGVAPAGVSLVHPLAWDAGQILRLHRALSRAGLHDIEVLNSATAAAIAVDSRHPALDGYRVTVVALRADGAEVQALRKDGRLLFRESGERVSVAGVPEVDLDAAMLDLIDAQLPRRLPDPGDDPALQASFAKLHELIRAARQKLCFEDSAIVGVKVPGRAAVIQVQRESFQQAVAPELRATLPALVAAIREASGAGLPPQQLILTGSAAPTPLLADLLREELHVPITIAGPRDGGSFGGALAAAALAPELPPLVMRALTGPVSVFADPPDPLTDEFAEPESASDSATEKKRRPLTLLQLWPITAAAAVLVALAGTASSGALDLTPAGDHPTTRSTDPAQTTDGSSTDSDEGPDAVVQTPLPSETAAPVTDGGTTTKKKGSPSKGATGSGSGTPAGPGTTPTTPATPTATPTSTSTPEPTPTPTDTATPTPDPTPDPPIIPVPPIIPIPPILP